MIAPIERRHREAALLALPDIERRFPGEFFAEEREWIETGVPTPGLDFGNAISVAQALADLEAATAHRAWNEGYDFAEHSFTDGHQANPYPATEPKPKP
jgi:hypothetical protein